MTGQLEAAVDALAEHLRDAGLNPTAVAKIAAAVFADPDRRSSGWVGPVTIADGIVLWINLPAKATP